MLGDLLESAGGDDAPTCPGLSIETVDLEACGRSLGGAQLGARPAPEHELLAGEHIVHGENVRRTTDDDGKSADDTFVEEGKAGSPIEHLEL